MFLELLALVFLVPVIWILFTYIKHVLSLRRYPPGPFPLPIIGNLNLIKGRPIHEVWMELAEKYGDVFSISLASRRIVVINSIEPAREALIAKGDIFSGRAQSNPMVEIVSRGFKDLAMSEGKRWRVLRKLVHSSLKTYGYGMDRIEKLISEESLHVNRIIHAMYGQPLDPEEMLGLAFLNVIGTLLFGKRYDYNDNEFRDLMEYELYTNDLFGRYDITMYFPFLGKFFSTKTMRLARHSLILRDPILDRKVKEHITQFNPDAVNDLTDHLIKYAKDMEEAGNDASEYIDEDSLAMIIHDFIIGGTETGLYTLGFAIRYLIHNPDIQNQLFEELQNELGEDVYPTLKDRSRLHLLEAVLHESLRLCTVAPIGIGHKTHEDTTIAGMNVAKGTIFYFNLWAIHHDPRSWDDPDKFDPFRWLDKDGMFRPGSQMSYIPFGVGRRNCIGESLAKAELFLLLGRLIVDFKFETREGADLPLLIPNAGFLLRPIQCHIKFTPRKVVFEDR